MAALDQLIGLRIRVKMADPINLVHEGELFAYDQTADTVALREPPLVVSPLFRA